MSAANILITQGTQSALPVDTVGTVNYPISKIDVGNLGSSVPWQGSVTMTAGTVNVGTVDTISQLPPGVFGTVINVAGTTFGTIKAGVGGSVIYVTDLTINMGVVAGTVALYNGGTANPIAGTFSFNPNGGIVENYRIPLQLTSGSALTYQQQGTSALSINVQGYVK